MYLLNFQLSLEEMSISSCWRPEVKQLSLEIATEIELTILRETILIYFMHVKIICFRSKSNISFCIPS